jgi:hypothetical protein
VGVVNGTVRRDRYNDPGSFVERRRAPEPSLKRRRGPGGEFGPGVPPLDPESIAH